MRSALVLSICALVLAACGAQDPKSRLAQACMGDPSATEAQCDCFAQEAEENLSPELFGKFVEALENGEEGGQELMSDLGPDEGVQLMGFIFSVTASCDMEMS